MKNGRPMINSRCDVPVTMNYNNLMLLSDERKRSYLILNLLESTHNGDPIIRHVYGLTPEIWQKYWIRYVYENNLSQKVGQT